VFPQVQAIGMVVDVLTFGWVELQHAFIVIPKQILDETHLFPIWASMFTADTDVFPILGNGIYA